MSEEKQKWNSGAIKERMIEIMSRKYDMRICKCGRIHMVSNEKIDKALEDNKNLLLICGGCGKAVIIGANIESEYNRPNKSCYMMYASDFSNYKDANISVSDFESTENYKGISEIVYSHGIKVPMKTGRYATNYYNGSFSDIWYPDFYKIQRKDITVKEVMDFIDEYSSDRTTVDMDRFISETPDEMLKVISQYWIEGFDWKGTKWEQKF